MTRRSILLVLLLLLLLAGVRVHAQSDVLERDDAAPGSCSWCDRNQPLKWTWDREAFCSSDCGEAFVAHERGFGATRAERFWLNALPAAGFLLFGLGVVLIQLRRALSRPTVWTEPPRLSPWIGLLVAPALLALVAWCATDAFRGRLLASWRGRGFSDSNLRDYAMLNLPSIKKKNKKKKKKKGSKGSGSPSGLPYREGKVLIVQRPATNRDLGLEENPDVFMHPPSVDSEWGALPEELRATTPGEVGTLIVLRTYGNWQLLIFDLKRKRRMAVLKLGKRKYPTFEHAGREWHMVDFVLAMPTRPDTHRVPPPDSGLPWHWAGALLGLLGLGFLVQLTATRNPETGLPSVPQVIAPAQESAEPDEPPPPDPFYASRGQRAPPPPDEIFYRHDGPDPAPEPESESE